MALSTKLISRPQIQQYKQLSNSNNNDKLNQIILESQFNDLRPLLGERFYNDLLDKVAASDPTYNDLLDGSDYTYRGTQYKNYGLRVVLANYVYARWILEGDVIDNPFGATIKMGTESEKPSFQYKKQLYTSNREQAYNYWLNVQKYILRNDFPLYTLCSKAKTSFRMSKISRT